MADATIIYHGRRAAPSNGNPLTPLDRPREVQWRPAAELLAGQTFADSASVLLADHEMIGRNGDLRDIPAPVVVVAVDTVSAQALGARADLSLAGVTDAVTRAHVLDAACKLATSRVELARLTRQLNRTENEFHELSRIGMVMMHERNRTALLHLIVSQGKQLTGSDGGGILLMETDAEDHSVLRPVVYEFDSIPDLGLPDILYGLDHTSVVGHAALTRQPLLVEDATKLPEGSAYTASREFQERYGYHARTLLAVPLIDQQDRVIGVLFVLNRKTEPNVSVRTAEEADRYVIGYTDREVRLVRALASLAAMSIENARLYVQIERMLESLVKAAVSAIDERDPSTAGHSLRVATLTVGLAEAVERATAGPYRDVRFSREQMRELHYAALMHDLGKVAVSEDVLMKAKKLPPVLWERVSARFDLIRRTLELDACASGSASELEARLAELDHFREIVRAANEPNVVATEPPAELEEIARRTYRRPDGTAAPFLMPDELGYLQLARGTLDATERAEIQSHVNQTYRFLKQIPWTDDLKNLVIYARGHHEKLDGSGYPKGLRADDIPVQTRMLTLADIFDALTEANRPYKPAVSPERALEIVRGEADGGQLDSDLVDILIESQVYRRVTDVDWRRLAGGSFSGGAIDATP